MNKKEIISEIRRIATENNGIPPGERGFKTETGIIKSDWFPGYWLRWSEAITEAGYEPNVFNKAYNEEFIIQSYIELIRELKHFPIEGELKRKRQQDKSFPGSKALYTFGKKQERIKKLSTIVVGKMNLTIFYTTVL